MQRINIASQQALDNYIALLSKLGADESNLLRRKTFLVTLLRDLEKIPHDGKVYGALLDDKLAMFTQPELKHFFQTSAREFFWFWSNDDEKIDAMMKGDIISVNPFCIKLTASLAELHVEAQQYYLAKPSVCLSNYSDSLQDRRDADVRLQWAQTLLYVMRDFDQEEYIYRSAVDTLMEAIDNRTMKQSILVVVREFHPIWHTYHGE